MTIYDIKRYALVQAIIAEIYGMRSANERRAILNMSSAYAEDDFFDKAEELRVIATKHDEQL